MTIRSHPLGCDVGACVRPQFEGPTTPGTLSPPLTCERWAVVEPRVRNRVLGQSRRRKPAKCCGCKTGRTLSSKEGRRHTRPTNSPQGRRLRPSHSSQLRPRPRADFSGDQELIDRGCHGGNRRNPQTVSWDQRSVFKSLVYLNSAIASDSMTSRAGEDSKKDPTVFGKLRTKYKPRTLV